MDYFSNVPVQGTFIARGEHWSYNKVEETDLYDITIYLQKYHELYNDGVKQTYGMVLDRFNKGFYDNSFVITNSKGIVNSVAVFWDNGSLNNTSYIWCSGLYIEGVKSSVCVMFMASLVFRQNINVLFFESNKESFANIYRSNGLVVEEFQGIKDKYQNYGVMRGNGSLYEFKD